jgi:uncharacterized protein (TIGR02452 family)
MASRKTRAEIAQQTVEILERGWYTLPDGTTVSLGDIVRDAVQRTRLYAPDDFGDVFARRDQLLTEVQNSGPTRFDVVNATTLAAARRLVDSRPPGDVVCLNFASAKNPGGGFLNGSQAQEESLARASGLYPCISPVIGYYATNRSHASCLYTDNMIYSPEVPVIRDDEDQLLAVPYTVSMITAPAVNAGAVRANEPQNVSQIEPVMLGRIEKLLSVAVVHGHRSLVLGAWGCGVFKNDPADVAAWFQFHLCGTGAFARAFDVVVFAVLDKTPGEPTLRAFADKDRPKNNFGLCSQYSYCESL